MTESLWVGPGTYYEFGWTTQDCLRILGGEWSDYARRWTVIDYVEHGRFLYGTSFR